jgi:hypothetical protein
MRITPYVKGRECALASIFAILTMSLLPKLFYFCPVYAMAETRANDVFQELTLAGGKQESGATLGIGGNRVATCLRL